MEDKVPEKSHIDKKSMEKQESSTTTLKNNELIEKGISEVKIGEEKQEVIKVDHEKKEK